MGKGGKGVWRWGKWEIIYLSLHCHHQNDSCIKMGSDESHFNVSVGKSQESVHRPQPFWREGRVELEAAWNQGLSAYKPITLPLGQTGSYLLLGSGATVPVAGYAAVGEGGGYKENLQAGIKFPTFWRLPSLGGYFFYNWTWVKTWFTQWFLKYLVTKTWWIKNTNCNCRVGPNKLFTKSSQWLNGI